jgi:hypothetical protein
VINALRHVDGLGRRFRVKKALRHQKYLFCGPVLCMACTSSFVILDLSYLLRTCSVHSLDILQYITADCIDQWKCNFLDVAVLIISGSLPMSCTLLGIYLVILYFSTCCFYLCWPLVFTYVGNGVFVVQNGNVIIDCLREGSGYGGDAWMLTNRIMVLIVESADFLI